jgi:hypothetical protein
LSHSASPAQNAIFLKQSLKITPNAYWVQIHSVISHFSKIYCLNISKTDSFSQPEVIKAIICSPFLH